MPNDSVQSCPAPVLRLSSFEPRHRLVEKVENSDQYATPPWPKEKARRCRYSTDIQRNKRKEAAPVNQQAKQGWSWGKQQMS